MITSFTSGHIVRGVWQALRALLIPYCTLTHAIYYTIFVSLQKKSVCVTVYDTGSRLNCITVSPTVMQKQATNSSEDIETQEIGTVCCDDGQKLGEKYGHQLMENKASYERSRARAVERPRHRYRSRRHRMFGYRGIKLPFSHRKVLSGRRFRCRQRLKMPPV